MKEIDGLRVFIAYSRKDLEFAHRLTDGLSQNGIEVQTDLLGITGGEVWSERLTDLISAADTIIVVLSPHAVASEILAWEVNEAERLSKRILPIVAESVSDDSVPGSLRRLNYVFFSEGYAFEDGLQNLVYALKTDLYWIREHTRLAELASHWNDRGKTEALLLRGEAIKTAQSWIQRRPNEAPQITAQQLEYIEISSASEAENPDKVVALQKLVADQKEREKQLLETQRVQAERIDALERSRSRQKRKRSGIFISYRRDDTKAYAGRLCDWLMRDFGAKRIFIDVDSITKGRDFTEILDHHLGRCDVMLALIGENWLDSRDDDGRRRLDDPEDFVRREIKSALSREIALIPVLVDDAKMPEKTELPEDLQALVLRQNYRITYENFGRDVTELKSHIRQHMNTKLNLVSWLLFLILGIVAIFSIGYSSGVTFLELVLNLIPNSK